MNLKLSLSNLIKQLVCGELLSEVECCFIQIHFQFTIPLLQFANSFLTTQSQEPINIALKKSIIKIKINATPSFMWRVKSNFTNCGLRLCQKVAWVFRNDNFTIWVLHVYQITTFFNFPCKNNSQVSTSANGHLLPNYTTSYVIRQTSFVR